MEEQTTDGENGRGLPASIERAWGIRERPTKGPKPGLSVARIVAASIELADTEGLAAVSMSRVAAGLGTSTMSLYRYVATKGELLALMLDAAVGPPPDPDPDAGWRASAERMARALLAVYRRHPWALRVPVQGPLPNQMAWLDAGVAALRKTGLDDAEKLSVATLVNGLARDEASLAADFSASAAESGSSPEAAMATYRAALDRLITADRFPDLHAAIASGALDRPQAPDARFTFGLERLLDGIEVLILRGRQDRA
jgi:AcrR family transcriptional regulator